MINLDYFYFKIFIFKILITYNIYDKHIIFFCKIFVWVYEKFKYEVKNKAAFRQQSKVAKQDCKVRLQSKVAIKYCQARLQ